MPPSNDAAEAGRVNALGDASAKQSSVGQVRPEEDNEAKPYILAGELGKGSFATVYKGYHEARVFSALISRVVCTDCSIGFTCSSRDKDS